MQIADLRVTVECAEENLELASKEIRNVEIPENDYVLDLHAGNDLEELEVDDELTRQTEIMKKVCTKCYDVGHPFYECKVDKQEKRQEIKERQELWKEKCPLYFINFRAGKTKRSRQNKFDKREAKRAQLEDPSRRGGVP